MTNTTIVLPAATDYAADLIHFRRNAMRPMSFLTYDSMLTHAAMVVANDQECDEAGDELAASSTEYLDMTDLDDHMILAAYTATLALLVSPSPTF